MLSKGYSLENSPTLFFHILSLAILSTVWSTFSSILCRIHMKLSNLFTLSNWDFAPHVLKKCIIFRSLCRRPLTFLSIEPLQPIDAFPVHFSVIKNNTVIYQLTRSKFHRPENSLPPFPVLSLLLDIINIAVVVSSTGVNPRSPYPDFTNTSCTSPSGVATHYLSKIS